MSDKHKTEPQVIPAVAPGSLTGDLAADSDDVATLKQRLGRARERLAFYESFDRIIQENIRRSSELMIEATGLREQAEREAEAQERALAAQRDQQDRDRTRSAALLGDLQSELDRARASLNAISARLTAARVALETEAPADEAGAGTDATAGGDRPTTGTAAVADGTARRVRTNDTAPAEVASQGERAATPSASATPTTPHAASPVSAEHAAIETGGSTPAAVTAPATGEPRVVDVLVHGVPTARVAISLQNHLRGLPQVSAVEAREFVEGLLRLQVTATAPVVEEDLAGWGDGAGSETVRALPDLLEISLPGTTER